MAGSKTKRLNALVSEEENSLIEGASLMAGATDNDPVGQASLDSAGSAVDPDARIALSEKGAAELLQALDNPPVPTKLIERARARRGAIRNEDLGDLLVESAKR